MGGDLAVVIAIAVWHLAALNSLSMLNGLPGLLAPHWVLLSSFHLLGSACAAAAAAAMIVGARIELLAPGFILGTALGCLDSYLIYRAVKTQTPQ